MRIALAFLFIALLATPLIYKRVSAHDKASRRALSKESVLNRYGFRFEESSRAAGRSAGRYGLR